jgi:hypothetical protein
MRSIKLILSQQMLKAVYYSHFHTIISYGLMFWGNSAQSARVFRMQKKIKRIMGQSGWMRKILAPPGFDPWTIQPVARCYTD